MVLSLLSRTKAIARVIKIDNALKKQFAFNSNKKKKDKEIIIYFLIVCEGEKTEPNYLLL